METADRFRAEYGAYGAYPWDLFPTIRDPQKADKNLKKHGVSLELASTVFSDPFHLSVLEGKTGQQTKQKGSNMKKAYNFKEGVRGKFYRPKKVQKTLRLDQDILSFYRELSHDEGISYQTLINLTLRKFAVEGGVLTLSTRMKRAQRKK